MSLPTCIKVNVFHFGYCFDDLPGIFSLGLATCCFAVYITGRHGHEKNSVGRGDTAIGFLFIPPKVDAHHPGIRVAFRQPAGTVGKVLPVDAAGPGPCPFRENHNAFFFFKKVPAFDKTGFNRLAISSPDDGHAF